MRSSFLFGLLMVAAVHGDALAQESGERGQRDVLAAVRLGYSQTLHDDLRAGDVRQQLLGSQFDIAFEAGPATVPGRLWIVGRFKLGLGFPAGEQRGDCGDGCEQTSFRIGPGLHWRLPFWEASSLAPWVSASIGWETTWLRVARAPRPSPCEVGCEFGLGGYGVDLSIGGVHAVAPSFAMGPYAQVSYTYYTTSSHVYCDTSTEASCAQCAEASLSPRIDGSALSTSVGLRFSW